MTDPTALLGEGSFGITYRAKMHGETVAAKLLKTEYITEELRDEFVEEATARTGVLSCNN